MRSKWLRLKYRSYPKRKGIYFDWDSTIRCAAHDNATCIYLWTSDTENLWYAIYGHFSIIIWYVLKQSYDRLNSIIEDSFQICELDLIYSVINSTKSESADSYYTAIRYIAIKNLSYKIWTRGLNWSSDIANIELCHFHVAWAKSGGRFLISTIFEGGIPYYINS